jgi:DNA (cytosine-5)-methyltransferase 1
MIAYYNEIDRFCCDWLSNLMDAELITPGKIDDRSIIDVRPDDLAGFAECHFFAGLGGWPLAFRLAGLRAGWSGSCPCQPFSSAGKHAGFSDPRDLWPVWFRLISQCHPARVLGEQAPTAIQWLDRLYTNLEAQDYAIGATVLRADAVRAKHKRRRLYFVAHSQRVQQSREEPCGWPAGRMGWEFEPVSWDRSCESALREFRALDDGLSYGVASTDAVRNAIVPKVAAEFIGAAMSALSDSSGIRQMNGDRK